MLSCYDLGMDSSEMIRRHQGGETPRQIAQAAGYSTNGVRDLLKRHGVYQPREVGRNSLARGRHLDKWGYVMVQVPSDWPYPSMIRSKRTGRGYVVEHRKVMAEHLGRALTSNETVHHINGNKQDNRVENLQLRQGRHGKGVTLRCRCCGSNDIEPVEL